LAPKGRGKKRKKKKGISQHNKLLLRKRERSTERNERGGGGKKERRKKIRLLRPLLFSPLNITLGKKRIGGGKKKKREKRGIQNLILSLNHPPSEKERGKKRGKMAFTLKGRLFFHLINLGDRHLCRFGIFHTRGKEGKKKKGRRPKTHSENVLRKKKKAAPQCHQGNSNPILIDWGEGEWDEGGRGEGRPISPCPCTLLKSLTQSAVRGRVTKRKRKWEGGEGNEEIHPPLSLSFYIPALPGKKEGKEEKGKRVFLRTLFFF